MLTPSGAKLLDFGLARRPSSSRRADDVDAVVRSAQADSGRHDPRHLPIHGAGAARRQGSRRAHRHLRARHADVRDGDRAQGVRRHEPGEPDRVDSHGATAGDFFDARRTAGLPPALDHVVERCLAKNPDDRWQTARDVKLELEWIAGGSSQAHASAAASARSRRARMLPWAVAARRGRGSGRRGDLQRSCESAHRAGRHPLRRRASGRHHHRVIENTDADSPVTRRTQPRIRRDDRRRSNSSGSARSSRLSPGRWTEPRMRFRHSGRRTAASSASFRPATGELKKIDASGGRRGRFAPPANSGRRDMGPRRDHPLHSVRARASFACSAEGGTPVRVTSSTRAGAS